MNQQERRSCKGGLPRIICVRKKIQASKFFQIIFTIFVRKNGRHKFPDQSLFAFIRRIDVRRCLNNVTRVTLNSDGRRWRRTRLSQTRGRRSVKQRRQRHFKRRRRRTRASRRLARSTRNVRTRNVSTFTFSAAQQRPGVLERSGFRNRHRIFVSRSASGTTFVPHPRPLVRRKARLKTVPSSQIVGKTFDRLLKRVRLLETTERRNVAQVDRRRSPSDRRRRGRRHRQIRLLSKVSTDPRQRCGRRRRVTRQRRVGHRSRRNRAGTSEMNWRTNVFQRFFCRRKSQNVGAVDADARPTLSSRRSHGCRLRERKTSVSVRVSFRFPEIHLCLFCFGNKRRNSTR